MLTQPDFDELAVDAWRALAACRPGSGVDAAIFFPTDGNGSAAPAKQVCATCTVCAECLAFAERSPQMRFGVWGGTTEDERRRAGRRRRRERLSNVVPLWEE